MSILRVSTFARLFRALSPCVGERTNSVTKIRFGERTGQRHYAAAIKFKVDSHNIVSSGFADITDFENVYVHDLIWEKIDRWWNHTALVCSETGRSYTYGQLRKACSKLATSLRKNNLLPGDVIAIILPNIPEFVIVLLAANEAGLQTTLINPAYTVYEIKRQLENMDAKAVVTFPAKYTEIKASIEQNSKIKLPIIMANDGTGDVSISGTIKLRDLTRDDIVDFSVNEKTGTDYEDTILLPYSSGTSGLPKGVELTHRNVVANVLQIAALSSGTDTTEHNQDIIPIILPLYHCYGLIFLMYHLRMGAKLVCMPKFSLEKLIKMLEDHRFTLMNVVPPILQMMAYNERITPRHVESMKTILTGAAPIGEESIAMFQNRVSDAVTLVQGYGMTEMSPVVTLGIAGCPLTSSGYLVPNTQMRIVGEKRDNLGPRELGEIYVRGPQVMKGYYKNPKATADTMDGDWYKTADIGYYTEEGFLYIQGRLKEMIKVKGYQVAPLELEELIRGYDKIQDVAVIGVAHEKYGEVPKAFVVPKSGVKIDEEELKQFVAQRAAKYKHLGYVQVVESIPKSASGKILRNDLQKM